MPSRIEENEGGPFDPDREDEEKDSSEYWPGDDGDTRDSGDGKTDEPTPE